MDDLYCSQLFESNKYLLRNVSQLLTHHAFESRFLSVAKEIDIEHFSNDQKVTTEEKAVVDLNQTMLIGLVP